MPFPAPIIARTDIAMGRLVDIPQMTKQHIVLASPIRMVGFLPNLSEALPHATAVTL